MWFALHVCVGDDHYIKIGHVFILQSIKDLHQCPKHNIIFFLYLETQGFYQTLFPYHKALFNVLTSL